MGWQWMDHAGRWTRRAGRAFEQSLAHLSKTPTARSLRRSGSAPSGLEPEACSCKRRARASRSTRIGRSVTSAHTQVPASKASRTLSYGKRKDPAKMTYSRMALIERDLSVKPKGAELHAESHCEDGCGTVGMRARLSRGAPSTRRPPRRLVDQRASVISSMATAAIVPATESSASAPVHAGLDRCACEWRRMIWIARWCTMQPTRRGLKLRC